MRLRCLFSSLSPGLAAPETGNSILPRILGPSNFSALIFVITGPDSCSSSLNSSSGTGSSMTEGSASGTASAGRSATGSAFGSSVFLVFFTGGSATIVFDSASVSTDASTVGSSAGASATGAGSSFFFELFLGRVEESIEDRSILSSTSRRFNLGCFYFEVRWFFCLWFQLR